MNKSNQSSDNGMRRCRLGKIIGRSKGNRNGIQLYQVLLGPGANDTIPLSK
jgi:hypothetical protein